MPSISEPLKVSVRNEMANERNTLRPVRRYIDKLAKLRFDNRVSDYIKVPRKIQHRISTNVPMNWQAMHPSCDVGMAVAQARHPFSRLAYRKRNTDKARYYGLVQTLQDRSRLSNKFFGRYLRHHTCTSGSS